jgi:putative spermidine/putrescine transport system permease protein
MIDGHPVHSRAWRVVAVHQPFGTFLVFVYVWLPYMILPMQAALERVPNSMLEASADLGASRAQTFRTVILPLALPGVIAGSIFTFSLTLGDYIIPQIVGTSSRFIGLAVYQLQGTAGNIPLAAAFAVVPILIMLIYLTWPNGRGPSMHSDRASWGLKIAAVGGLLFLHLPILLIFLYAFTTEDASYQFPPPGLTTQWFGVAWNREDIWPPLYLSLGRHHRHLLAMILGTLVAAAMARASFFGREQISLLIILPIALPGVITGMSLRSAFDHGHPVFDLDHHPGPRDLLHRHRLQQRRRPLPPPVGRDPGSLADLGANSFQTFRYVLLPNLGTALLAGGMLAFALSFDEVIVTTFTAGQQSTLPIWMLNELVRPRQRPVTNVVAIVVFAATFVPILIAYYLTRGGSETAGMGK